MKFIERFKIKMKSLGIQPDSKILVAVSGGVDSMVLLSLTANGGFSPTAAHVNFKLRGEESNRDEVFVKDTCKKMNISLFTSISPIDKDAQNIQLAAREARYQFFEMLCAQHGFEFILTAHHRDDYIETFFMHLIRGSGLKGLRSIPEKNDLICRPLLEFSKTEILEYALKNNISWREDATNKETDYLRNKIRHGLAADFAQIAPFANENLVKSIGFITEAHAYFERHAREFVTSLTRRDGLYFIIDENWNELFDKKPLHKYVFESFGFIPDQLNALETFGESQTGKKIQSHTHVAYRNRGGYVIQPIGIEFDVEIPITLQEGKISVPLKLEWYTQKKSKNLPEKENRIAVLDCDKLRFPLRIRNWKPGDKFKPLGMKGMKKISDFLTDLKLSIPEKENITVIESAGDICWVVGHRIDERFKPTSATKNILIMKYSGLNR